MLRHLCEGGEGRVADGLAAAKAELAKEASATPREVLDNNSLDVDLKQFE
jgi:hypothetical protein